NIALIVKKRERRSLKCEVVRGGILREKKGVNIPDAVLKFPMIARNDLKDARFGIENRVDFIAQSFVRSKKDIAALKSILGDKAPHCCIIAKIENREGINNIDEIIDSSDGIMIARGDMGISIPIYEVPMVQKGIIAKCRKKGKFVITATQMLESMTEHMIPTRAEVSDVANAILDGTDYAMLSAETAVGKYPVEAVDMMDQVIAFTEKSGGRPFRRNLGLLIR
ncbi:pyruvate kinase, partial [Candidatus Omnitrophota bacterium]